MNPGRVLEKGLVLLEYRDVYAGGRLVGSGSTDVITIVNPATEEVTGAVPSMVQRDVEVAVAAARQAFDTGGWPLLSAAERAAATTRSRPRMTPQMVAACSVTSRLMSSPKMLSAGSMVIR